jgi:hypothetical protein
MRIILMLRRVLSFLLVCALAVQSVSAVAAGASGTADPQACHDMQQPHESGTGGHHAGGASSDCAVHCFNAAALPASVPVVAADPAAVYDRVEPARAPTRFDVPPIPPPIH